MFDAKDLTPVTCSSLKSFKLCRKDYKLRFIDGLQPVEENEVQYLGSVVHGCLERWHGRGEKDAETTVADILDYIDASYPDSAHDEKQKKNRHVARAMFPGYGLFMISHATDKEIETRTGKYTKTVPTLPDKARKLVLGMADLILFCDLDVSKDEDGSPVHRRVIRSKPALNYEAGDRTGCLPDVIDLDFQKFKAAYLDGKKAKTAAKPKKKEG